MEISVEIDDGSGFCFGVTTAISKAEEELAKGGRLHCLGDIVHNGKECERLREMGLDTIGHEEFANLNKGERVLLRAHGEPPQTYQTAKLRGIEIIDATCPVVLMLQKRIKQVYSQIEHPQIVIYGKPGHAEVLGLVGQTRGEAIVIATPDEASRLDFGKDIYLFSQTTQPLEGFRQIVDYIKSHIKQPASFKYYDTICRQVANRLPNIRNFASKHDVIIFACGQKSSNGKVLYEACRSVNPLSYMIDDPKAIAPEWFADAKSVGICGATSTPKWLMEECREHIYNILK